MEIIKHIASVVIGLGSGLVVAGAVYAFITIVGVVPRLAQKTHTTDSIRVYESALALGGIFGTLAGVFQFYLPIGHVMVVSTAVFAGIFVGCLAMSLAEVLNVIPILTRRTRLQKGMFLLVLAVALGKLVGALMYFLIPGFFDTGAM